MHCGGLWVHVCCATLFFIHTTRCMTGRFTHWLAFIKKVGRREQHCCFKCRLNSQNSEKAENGCFSWFIQRFSWRKLHLVLWWLHKIFLLVLPSFLSLLTINKLKKGSYHFVFAIYLKAMLRKHNLHFLSSYFVQRSLFVIISTSPEWENRDVQGSHGDTLKIRRMKVKTSSLLFLVHPPDLKNLPRSFPYGADPLGSMIPNLDWCCQNFIMRHLKSWTSSSSQCATGTWIHTSLRSGPCSRPTFWVNIPTVKRTTWYNGMDSYVCLYKRLLLSTFVRYIAPAWYMAW